MIHRPGPLRNQDRKDEPMASVFKPGGKSKYVILYLR